MCGGCEEMFDSEDVKEFAKELERLAKVRDLGKKDLGDVLRKKYQVSKESYDKNQLK